MPSLKQPDVQNEKKKQFVLALIAGFVALVALVSLRFVSFTNDINVMLPEQEEIQTTFDFFRSSPLAENVFVSLEIKEENDFPKLIEAVTQFSASMNSPMIKRVLKGMEASSSMESVREFVRLAPQGMSAEELQNLDAQINETFVKEKIAKLYRNLLSPAGFVATAMLAQDPLDFQKNKLKRLQTLASSMEYAVELREGHFISRDGLHALVILETDVAVTDGTQARELINFLEGSLSSLPEAVSSSLVAGHLHSLSNEKVIKRDIFVTVSVASLGFLGLFLFLFKDIRGILLFMVPFVSVLLAIPICAQILGKLSYIIMGMGAVISGIAVDYCIHVYVAMQSGQERKAAVGEVTKPILIGALTTVGVFSVFLLSSVPGYRELSLFTVVSILLSLGLAILLLPHFLSKNQAKSHTRRQEFQRFLNIPDKAVIVVWGVLLGICFLGLPFVHFKTDVKQYDGSEMSIFKTEEKFYESWGGKERPAMLVVKAANFNGALERNYQIQPEIDLILEEGVYRSLSQIWPPELVRLENLVRWNRYWKDGRGDKLKALFQANAEAYDFSMEAFEPFFKMLYLGPEEVKAFEELEVLGQLKQRFGFETEQGYQLISFFPDDDKNVEALSKAGRSWNDVFIVSAKQFSRLLSKAILFESFFLSLMIALIIPALTFLFLRDFRLISIALIPVISSVVVILGMLTLLKLPMNAASIIALLVVGGLSIDYGIFMVYQSHKQLKTNTRMAVTLSALTTLFGAGALVMAKHPVLFSYGTTMVLGISAGYFAAIFVVPALYRMMNKKKAFRTLRETV